MSDPSRARMVWRCRRGMKELDLILLGWLASRYEQASAMQREQFERLLELPDPLLARYLMGRERPLDPAQAALIATLVSPANIMLPTAAAGNLPEATLF